MLAAIRVDGNATIGIGHVLRCNTLAKKLLEYGIECIFLTRSISENLKKLIDESFEHISLEENDPLFNPIDEYSQWLGVSEVTDANEFLCKTKSRDVKFVIVDHYGIGSAWETIVREKFDKLIVIDDLANRKHVSDLLVDQSIGRETTSYVKLVPTNCSVLVGTKFALLREEFAMNTENIDKRYDIFINFGGADKDNYTLHVLNILEKSNLSDELSLKVVFGKDYTFKSQLFERVKCSRFNIKVVESPKKLACEISECRFAIGAGGVSLLERSALAVPSILYAMAENQFHICEEYSKRKLGFMMLKDTKAECRLLLEAIRIFLEEHELSIKSAANKNLVDARGVNRVIIELLTKINLFTNYEASLGDAKFIYDCRYKSSSETMYLNQTIPVYEQHLEWFTKSLNSEKKTHVIYEVCGVQCGYIRIDEDINEEFNELSIYVHENFRGRGFSKKMLSDICKKYGRQKLYATVNINNVPSVNAFLKSGFNISSQNQNFIRLKKCRTIS